jgi:hypothetical protein
MALIPIESWLGGGGGLIGKGAEINLI